MYPVPEQVKLVIYNVSGKVRKITSINNEFPL